MDKSISKELKDNIKKLIELGAFEDAENLLMMYKDLDGDDIETYSMLGVINIIREKIFEAEKFLLEGLKIDERNFDLLFNLGYVYELAGHMEKTVKYYILAHAVAINEGQKQDIQEKIKGIDLIFSQQVEYINNTVISKIELELCENAHSWCLNIDSVYEVLCISEKYLMKRLFLKSYVAMFLLNKDFESSAYDTFIASNYMIKPDRYKIFQGTINIANQMSIMTEALRNNGMSVKSHSLFPQDYLMYDVDEVVDFLNIRNDKYGLARIVSWLGDVIFEYDIFHFHFGTTLLAEFRDLNLIKRFNKKIVMTHWGSDVRQIELASKLTPFAVAKQDSKSIHENLIKLSPFVDICTVCDMELFYYTKKYYKSIKIIPLVYKVSEMENVSETNINKKTFRIVHAPTSREFKGTQFVEMAIQSLKNKGHSIEYILVEGISNNEALKLYETADIVIDQLRAGQYGFLAVECMVRNIPVISYISDYMKEYYNTQPPIINANIDNIENVIEKCLFNYEEVMEISKKGFDYINQHHNVDLIVHELIKIYDELAEVL